MKFINDMASRMGVSLAVATMMAIPTIVFFGILVFAGMVSWQLAAVFSFAAGAGGFLGSIIAQ